MKAIRLLLCIFIPDIGGIIFNIIPMFLFLSITDFFRRETQYSVILIAAILLISLGLLLIPFRLIIIFVHLFKLNIDVYGVWSIAIIGGLIGGSFYYLLIPSHFSINWINLPDFALLGVIQSVIAQTIFNYIPEEWQLRLEE